MRIPSVGEGPDEEKQENGGNAGTNPARAEGEGLVVAHGVFAGGGAGECGSGILRKREGKLGAGAVWELDLRAR